MALSAKWPASIRRRSLPLPGGRVELRNGPSSGPSLTICTLATGTHREMLSHSAPTLLALGRQFGWDLVISCESLTDRPPSWSKLLLIRELLPTTDYVLWVDADAIVVDPTRNILAEATSDAVWWCARHPQERQDDASVLNAGVMLVRNTPRAVELIDAVWECNEYIQHNWWENAALLHVLGYSLEPPYRLESVSPWHDLVGTLDLCWNSVPGYCESAHPAISHHARADGQTFTERVGAMEADRVATLGRRVRPFAV